MSSRGVAFSPSGRAPSAPLRARGQLTVTDEALMACAPAYAITVLQPCGPCRMWPGGKAVADDRLRVHGIDGLRVAEASMMPTMTSGNTNAPTIVIGEKAADMIR